MTATEVPFLEVVKDVSASNVKIPQSAFSRAGRLAIVDQGSSLIAGYTDNLGATVKAEGPVIVFGDHTRALKYVDFPFAMGADGVKVLHVRDGFDVKFVFRFLQSRMIPSAGYSRHFKFLKDLFVPRPPLAEQCRIAAILDQADALRTKRRQVLIRLEDFSQSIFAASFGAESFPLSPAGELMPAMRNGLSPATDGQYEAEVLTLSAVTQGRFDPRAVKPGFFSVEPPADKRVTARDFLMCRGNGNKSLVGVGVFSEVARPNLVFPDTVIAGRVDPTKIAMPYLAAAWKQPEVRRQIAAAARTTNGTYKVNQQTLSSISLPVPPLSLQHKFASRVEYVKVQTGFVRRALLANDELFASIQARAFGGSSNQQL